MLEYGRPMNENDMTDRQRYRKVQGGVKIPTEASRSQIECSRGGGHGGVSESESGVILRNIVKADPCVFMKTRVEVIFTGEVECVNIRRLDRNRQEEVEA